MSELSVVSQADLAAHGPTSKSPWVQINGIVYDVSKFAALHPGGEQLLLRACGSDASEDYNMVHHPAVLKNPKYARLAVGRAEGKARRERRLPYADHYWLDKSLPSPHITEEHRAWQKKVRAFIDTEIQPNVGKWDEAKKYPKELHKKIYEAGLYSPMWPVELGGTPPEGGWDYIKAFIGYYENGRILSGGFSASFFSVMIALPPLIHHGDKYIKEKFATPLIKGEAIGALAITEPWAGSDVSRLRCTAILDGDEYVINGAKKFITSGMQADLFTVACRTDPNAKSLFDGISLIVVEGNRKGLDRRRINTQGWWAGNTGYITFENVRVPKANVIGEVNKGFRYIMENFNNERFMMCCSSLAASHVLLGESIRFAKVRKTFGKPLIQHQVIRHKIANMAMQSEALYALVEQIACHLQNNTPQIDIAPKIAFCKVLATKTYEFCAREASQIFGGNSYQRGGQGENVERLYRDVRVQAIGGGSEEIMTDLGLRMSKL